ncbi:hypothetical protein CDEF62S_03553 [Castellaniella defragrans]
MDLTTRCPNCGTVFQAGLADLQLRKGYIRCVQCAHIFDGYAEVVRDSESQASAERVSSNAADAAGPKSPTGPDTGAPSSADIPWDETAPQVIRAGRSLQRAEPRARDPEFSVGVAPWPDDRPSADPAWDEPHVGFGSRDASYADESGIPGGYPDPSAERSAIVVEANPSYRGAGGSAAPLLRADSPPSVWRPVARFFGSLLIVVLVLLFVAQLVYVYRGQVAQFVPGVRPWLEQACVPLRCRVPYARDISQISITGSALKVADTEPAAPPPASGHAGSTAAQPAEQHFVLQFTLRNQLGRAQEWPTLVVDLKDGSGTLLVRRNLSPSEYLGPTMMGQPFAARSEALVRVPLTLSGVRINGYQLDLFFP